MKSFEIRTARRDEFREITDEVQAAVSQSGVASGYAIVYVPHTTAGVTINENADPTVKSDMLGMLDRMIPWEQPFFRHGEGNSAAHVKSSLMGHSATVLIRNGKLVLGTWQGIYFCEFDGPRNRSVHVKVCGD